MEKFVLSSISVEQLAEIISKEIKKEIKNDLLNESPQVKSDFLTRKQTAEILNVSLPSLHEWTMAGKIPAYRIGTRVRYKRNEVEQSVRKINLIGKEATNEN